jgi:hypothetical protein
LLQAAVSSEMRISVPLQSIDPELRETQLNQI